MKTQRDAFWQRIYELASADRDVIVVSADMGAPALDRFRRDLPAQYVNVGIAEQQAVAVAAGLALGGKKVFAYAIAPFITLRCYEHIRLELAAMNLPVTLVGVGSGISYEESGPTHHTVEDLSVLRILPNFQIHNVTDAVMAAAMADVSRRMPNPNYVRLDRKPLPTLYASGHDFSPGLHLFRRGRDACLLATGNMVHRALQVAEAMSREGVEASVVDVYTLPIPEAALVAAIGASPVVFTLEEHTLPGGFGSAVCEVLADRGMPVRVRRFGFDLRCGYCYRYGGREHLLSLYGLDTPTLTRSMLDVLAAQPRGGQEAASPDALRADGGP